MTTIDDAMRKLNKLEELITRVGREAEAARKAAEKAAGMPPRSI